MEPLQPSRPPGHGLRKALAYASEIGRLRDEGYSMVAIQKALEAVGVVVSKSTVQREAKLAKASKRKGAASTTSRAPKGAPVEPPKVVKQPDNVLVDDRRSPREVAQAFMQANDSNPLLNPQSNTRKGKP